jgi:hyperosmotically inducible periplasmic protein
MIFGNSLVPVTIPGHTTTYRYQQEGLSSRAFVRMPARRAGQTAKDVRSHSCTEGSRPTPYQARNMKTLKPHLSLLALALAGTLIGCSTKSPDFKDVSVSQDRGNGVVILGGRVSADGDKSQAESIARSSAGAEVVSNQIAVRPPGDESAAKTVNSDLDQGIERNLDAALIEAKLHDNVRYEVKNHDVTLTGNVDSQTMRSQAETVASAVPNVQQVVNELQVKGQKATSLN